MKMNTQGITKPGGEHNVFWEVCVTGHTCSKMSTFFEKH